MIFHLINLVANFSSIYVTLFFVVIISLECLLFPQNLKYTDKAKNKKMVNIIESQNTSFIINNNGSRET